jgi:hypothetical protein
MHLATGNIRYLMVWRCGVEDIQTSWRLSVQCVHVSDIYTVVLVYNDHNTAGHKQLPRRDTCNVISDGCVQRELINIMTVTWDEWTVNYDYFYLVSAWIPKAMYFQLVYIQLCKLARGCDLGHADNCVSNSGLPAHQWRVCDVSRSITSNSKEHWNQLGTFILNVLP